MFQPAEHPNNSLLSAVPRSFGRRFLELIGVTTLLLLNSGVAQSLAVHSFAEMPGAGFYSPTDISPNHVLGPYTVTDTAGAEVTLTARNYLEGSPTLVSNDPPTMGSHTAGSLCPIGLCHPVDYAVTPGDWWGQTCIGTADGIVLNFDQPLSAAGLSLIFTLKPGDPMQGILLTAFDEPNTMGQALGTALSDSYPFINAYAPGYERHWYNVRFFVGIELGTAQIRSLLIQQTAGTYTPSIDGYSLRASTVPEPGTAVLLALGLAGLDLAGNSSHSASRKTPIWSP